LRNLGASILYGLIVVWRGGSLHFVEEDEVRFTSFGNSISNFEDRDFRGQGYT